MRVAARVAVAARMVARALFSNVSGMNGARRPGRFEAFRFALTYDH